MTEPRLDKNGNPEGWFSKADAHMYIDAVSNAPNEFKLVEIGTWLGRSISFVMPIAIAKNAFVHCVDPWDGGEQEAMKKHVTAEFEPFKTFQANMEHLGFWSSLRAVKALSTDFARSVPDEFLDIVMIDANHEYDYVKEDINAWWPKLKDGGVMLGHDYSSNGWGVRQAVDERFGKPDRVGGSVWMKSKS